MEPICCDGLSAQRGPCVERMQPYILANGISTRARQWRSGSGAAGSGAPLLRDGHQAVSAHTDGCCPCRLQGGMGTVVRVAPMRVSAVRAVSVRAVRGVRVGGAEDLRAGRVRAGAAGGDDGGGGGGAREAAGRRCHRCARHQLLPDGRKRFRPEGEICMRPSRVGARHGQPCVCQWRARAVDRAHSGLCARCTDQLHAPSNEGGICNRRRERARLVALDGFETLTSRQYMVCVEIRRHLPERQHAHRGMQSPAQQRQSDRDRVRCPWRCSLRIRERAAHQRCSGGGPARPA